VSGSYHQSKKPARRETAGFLMGRCERFQAKWRPVRVKKTRQIKNPERRFDSIETEKALARADDETWRRPSLF
jgi:hypothetical protein